MERKTDQFLCVCPFWLKFQGTELASGLKRARDSKDRLTKPSNILRGSHLGLLVHPKLSPLSFIGMLPKGITLIGGTWKSVTDFLRSSPPFTEAAVVPYVTASEEHLMERWKNLLEECQSGTALPLDVSGLISSLLQVVILFIDCDTRLSLIRAVANQIFIWSASFSVCVTLELCRMML
ncbi:hypothetical protein CRM22_000594 [Opisthorchis felineus]|uniref:Uncharacterized protein n=1 Tax=Opisthorchis felineus TaxID=147828 RepID=A0A4S2MEB6_OPIFE|nr:hypothetical protein CRM22_000594 [Opisthorchis felineus]